MNNQSANNQSAIINAVNALDINAEAEEDYLAVQVGFYCPMGMQQMLAVFHGDAKPERVAHICHAIRAALNDGNA